jgi:hypothetical protein
MPVYNSSQEIIAAAKDGRVDGIVQIKLRDIIEEDWQGFHLLVAENLLGSKLADQVKITYKVCGYTDDSVHLNVSADLRLIEKRMGIPASLKGTDGPPG